MKTQPIILAALAALTLSLPAATGDVKGLTVQQAGGGFTAFPIGAPAANNILRFTGDPTDPFAKIASTTAGLNMLIAADVAAQKTLLNLSGTNTGDQTITLTGNVTGSGSGSFATTIAASAVTNSMLAGSIAASKLVGSDIATLGTVTTGTWQATTIGTAYGGTGIDASASTGFGKFAAGVFSVESAATHLTSIGGTTAGVNVFKIANPGAISFLRFNADNSTDALSASAFRTAIGGTTLGANLFTVPNPSAVTFLRLNADNSVDTRSASQMRSDLGVGTGTFSGPGSATDNAIMRFDGTGGATGQNSGVTIDDSDRVTIPGSAGASLPAHVMTGSTFAGTGTTSTPFFLIQPTGTTAQTTWPTAGTWFGMNVANGNTSDFINIRSVTSNVWFRVDAFGNTTIPSLMTAGTFTMTGSTFTVPNSFGIVSVARGQWNMPQDGTFRIYTNGFSGAGIKVTASDELTTMVGDFSTAGKHKAATFEAATQMSATKYSVAAVTGTNQAGTATSYEGGIGTGTGIAGAIQKKTGLTGTTGSTAHVLTNREYVFAGEKTLTESTATIVVNVALASSKYMGGTLTATTHADDGTDFQATTEHFTFAAVNKAGTVTPVIQATPSTSTTAASSVSTLTTAWTIVANGAGLDIKNNAVSSLTQTTLKVTWQLTLNGDGTAAVTP